MGSGGFFLPTPRFSLMNEDPAETSQIGMNFAAPKALIPWPDRSVTTTLGAAKSMPIWLVSAESSFITNFGCFPRQRIKDL